MRVLTDKQFNKAYARLPEKVKVKFKQRRNLFLENDYTSLLQNHTLAGKYSGFRSINITGDFRAIYYLIEKDLAVFVNIGTHSQLYG